MVSPNGSQATRFYVMCLLAWAVVIGAPKWTSAATLMVTNLNNSGTGSLRAAIAQAATTPEFDRIVFAPNLTGTILFLSPITITSDLSIEGPGPRQLTFDGDLKTSLLTIEGANTVNIAGVRFARGHAFAGGAIYTIFGSPHLTIEDCHFDINLADADGGAMCILGGTFSVRRCTFTTCQARNYGGGILWGGTQGQSEVTNCTFVNNYAGISGGAFAQYSFPMSSSRLTHCTMVINHALSEGGAIVMGAGTMTLRNMLLDSNGAGGSGGHIRRTGGTLISLGNNLFGHIDGANFTPADTDRFGTMQNPLNTGVMLALPFDNGGLTDTLPFVSTSSIAIDGAAPDPAAWADQRNFPRVGCAPDVGAFEHQMIVDDDEDGVPNCLDHCADTPVCAAVNQLGCPIDSDNDGVPDGCDECPGTTAGDPVDADGCSTADEDGDDVPNDVDKCRGTPACALGSVDAFGCPMDEDGDGLFDGCDRCRDSDDLTDSDADGIPDCLDPCPNAIDSDGDGVQDCQDGCPNDAAKLNPGVCGCGVADADSDGDGVPDCLDACPNTIDSDGDGVQDCQDGCPNDAAKLNPGACGCGVADADSDGDGVPDCLDPCPSAVDSDGDGVQDCQDGCPADALKLAPGTCGCGVSDADTNGDGFADCLDEAVNQSTGQPTPTGDEAPNAAAPFCGAGAASSAAMMLPLLWLLRGRRGSRKPPKSLVKTV